MHAFTTTEARAVTCQSAKRIQKLIEREFICCRTEEQGSRARRVLEPADILMVLILEERRDLLSHRLRQSVHQRLHELGTALERVDQVEVEGVVVLRVESTRKRLQEEVGRLEEARKMVVESSNVMAGEPVIRRARIPVHQVAVEHDDP